MSIRLDGQPQVYHRAQPSGCGPNSAKAVAIKTLRANRCAYIMKDHAAQRLAVLSDSVTQRGAERTEHAKTKQLSWLVLRFINESLFINGV